MGDRSLTCTHDLYKEKTKKEKITMKKTYMIPTLQVVKIQTTGIMIGSAPQLQGSTDLTSGNLGRRARFSDFDDEWDEE